MFCPKCGREYKESTYICSKCRVSLVPELLPDPTNESPALAEFQQILFTPNAGDMAVIKSLLDNEGIVYFFRGEFFTSAHPLVQPARLMVSRDQVEEVKGILESLNITYSVG